MAAEWLRGEFDRCWPWLEAALEQFGHTHTKEDVWRRISSRKAFFFPAEKSAVVGEILNYPTGLRSGHIWLAGGDLEDIKARIPTLEAYAKHLGCHRLTIDGRRGWLRAIDGYHEFCTRMVKNL